MQRDLHRDLAPAEKRPVAAYDRDRDQQESRARTKQVFAMSEAQRLIAVSLFSGAGIGDLGFRAGGFDIVAAAELLPDRLDLLKCNFPEASTFQGDLWETWQDVVAHCKTLRYTIDVVIATPPCQGMSANGTGKLLREIREGRRSKWDPRNRLLLPALNVIEELQPRWVIFENVPKMAKEVICDEDGTERRLTDVICKRLNNYIGSYQIIECADYGAPQKRQRFLGIYRRASHGFGQRGADFTPPPSHAEAPRSPGISRWVTLRDAIGNFPALDGKEKSTAKHPSIPLHVVPVLDPKKYEWIRHTPERASAFDNQCVNTICLSTANPRHGARRTAGINQARTDTPLYCTSCGSLLPRPYAADKDGTLRIMRGFTSAYKRMRWDAPCPTITRNQLYPCSDHKIHPEQNRVLSIAEMLRIMTVDRYEYSWLVDGRQAKNRLICDVLGEALPPLVAETIASHIVATDAALSTESIERWVSSKEELSAQLQLCLAS